MSISGITTTNFAQFANVKSLQKVQTQFKQVGDDLNAGNLTKAQTDFATLTQSLTSASPVAQPPVGPTAVTPARAQSGGQKQHPLTTALSQAGQALQSGNITLAQQAWASVQQLWKQVFSHAVTPTEPGVTALNTATGGVNFTG